MTKSNLFWTSFVAAVPGAYLLFLMLMAVFRHMEAMPGLLKGVAIVALLMALAIFAFPAYIFVWHGGYVGLGTGTPKKKEKAQDQEEAAEVAATPAKGDSAIDEASQAGDLSGEADLEKTGPFDESSLSDAAAGESDEVIFEPSGELEDDFEFEEFDDEEK